MNTHTVTAEMFLSWPEGAKHTATLRHTDVRRLERAIAKPASTATKDDLVVFINDVPAGAIRQRVASSLRSFYRHAIAQGVVNVNPMQTIRIGRHDQSIKIDRI